MSSTNNFDIPLRGRPYSQDIDDGNAILSDLVVRLVAMMGETSAQIPTGAFSAARPVCAGLAATGVGVDTLTISAGTMLTQRPTTYPTPGTYDTTDLIVSTSAADTLFDMSAVATGWHLVGARPAIVSTTTALEDVFNSPTGQFQAATVTVAYGYTFELYSVFGSSSAWPVHTSWAPNVWDMPLCLAYFDGAVITSIVDLRVLPGDTSAAMTWFDEGRAQYKCSASLPSKMSFYARDAWVAGLRGSLAGLPIFINDTTLDSVLDQANGSTPIAAKQQYWAYLCPAGSYMPRNAYGTAVSTQGLLVLSRAQPQQAVIASTSYPGPAARVNSAALTLPAQFGGGSVLTGNAICIGFVESGNTTAAWRTMWSNGDNDHRFGQSPESGAFPGTPNWLGFAPATPGTGAAYVTLSIYKSAADATVIDTATRFARSILLDIRVAGNPAPSALWMALPANNTANPGAGDLAAAESAPPVSTTIYLRSSIPGEEFASGTTIHLFSDAAIPATTDCDCELLGYSW